MNETSLLLIIMGCLALIEVGLIVSIQQLKKTLQSINDKGKKLDLAVSRMAESIEIIKKWIGGLSGGKIKVEGKTPIGAVNLELELKK